MKHDRKIVLALVASLMAAPAFAQAPASAPRTLSMTGQGEVKAAPDTVALSAGVSTAAPTAAAALAANTAKMQAVMAALKKLSLADKDIQTANFSVSPQMISANNQPPHVTGYEVNNQLRVRLDDVTKLGAALDALVASGANQMNGIDFSIRDSAELLAQARTDAVADATLRAQTYARAAGVTLGPILSLSEGGNDGPRPMYMAAPMMARAGKAVPVAMGEQSVAATVSIVWEIR